MPSIPTQSNYGSFIATTLDVSSISTIPGISNELKQLLIQLYQNFNDVCVQLNLKDTGYYDTDEFLTNILFFPTESLLNTSTSPNLVFRPVFRKVINFGALPNATSASVAHGINTTINSDIIFTRIYGTATNPATSFIPLPFASPTLNLNISVEVTATDVVITTGTDRTSYTTCYIVLEYIK